ISPRHPLRKLFDVLVQRTFVLRFGMPDRDLVGYLADVLTRFTHVDNIFRIRDAKGRRLEEVAEMLEEVYRPSLPGTYPREREIHRHIGDFTLFWTGVYPEALRYLRHETRKDHLVDYVEQGKQSYYRASTFGGGQLRREAQVLRQLSERFEVCMFGLNLVRQDWEQLGDPRSGFARDTLVG
ncbi:MAG: hypothetical protein ACE5R4_11640, partial [Armatimonadota bacterium]